MTLQKLFITIYTTTILSLLILLGTVLFLMNTLTEVYTSQETRYKSYLLVDELRPLIAGQTMVIRKTKAASA